MTVPTVLAASTQPTGVEADRAILTDAATKALRAKLAAFVAPYELQVKLLDGRVPSYVSSAAVALVASLQRWERDEKAVS